MKRFIPAAALVIAWILLPAFAEPALACSCMGPADARAAMSAATAVFAGRAVYGDVQTVRFQVDKVWKGAEAPEIMVLTGTQVYSNGMMSMSSCDINYSIGTEYVVYASGGPQDLKSHSCSRTAPLQEAEARALDAVTPHKKVGNDVRSCSTDSSSNGEIRLVTSDTNRAAIRAVRIAVERINDRPGVSQFGVVTNTAGKAAITSLPPGEYTITADLDGYSPRRMTVQIKPQACVEASVFLLRVPIRKD